MSRRHRPTGKGDLGHQRVLCQGLSAWHAASDDVDHTIRNACPGNQLSKFQQRRRRMFRGLEHNRVSRRQRRADFHRAQKHL